MIMPGYRRRRGPSCASFLKLLLLWLPVVINFGRWGEGDPRGSAVALALAADGLEDVGIDSSAIVVPSSAPGVVAEGALSDFALRQQMRLGGILHTFINDGKKFWPQRDRFLAIPEINTPTGFLEYQAFARKFLGNFYILDSIPYWRGFQETELFWPLAVFYDLPELAERLKELGIGFRPASLSLSDRLSLGIKIYAKLLKRTEILKILDVPEDAFSLSREEAEKVLQFALKEFYFILRNNPKQTSERDQLFKLWLENYRIREILPLLKDFGVAMELWSTSVHFDFLELFQALRENEVKVPDPQTLKLAVKLGAMFDNHTRIPEAINSTESKALSDSEIEKFMFYATHHIAVASSFEQPVSEEYLSLRDYLLHCWDRFHIRQLLKLSFRDPPILSERVIITDFLTGHNFFTIAARHGLTSWFEPLITYFKGMGRSNEFIVRHLALSAFIADYHGQTEAVDELKKMAAKLLIDVRGTLVLDQRMADVVLFMSVQQISNLATLDYKVDPDQVLPYWEAFIRSLITKYSAQINNQNVLANGQTIFSAFSQALNLPRGASAHKAFESVNQPLLARLAHLLVELRADPFLRAGDGRCAMDFLERADIDIRGAVSDALVKRGIQRYIPFFSSGVSLSVVLGFFSSLYVLLDVHRQTNASSSLLCHGNSRALLGSARCSMFVLGILIAALQQFFTKAIYAVDVRHPLSQQYYAKVLVGILFSVTFSPMALFNQLSMYQAYLVARSHLDSLRKFDSFDDPALAWQVPGFFRYDSLQLLFKRKLSSDEQRDSERVIASYRSLFGNMTRCVISGDTIRLYVHLDDYLHRMQSPTASARARAIVPSRVVEKPPAVVHGATGSGGLPSTLVDALNKALEDRDFDVVFARMAEIEAQANVLLNSEGIRGLITEEDKVKVKLNALKQKVVDRCLEQIDFLLSSTATSNDEVIPSLFAKAQLYAANSRCKLILMELKISLKQDAELEVIWTCLQKVQEIESQLIPRDKEILKDLKQNIADRCLAEVDLLLQGGQGLDHVREIEFLLGRAESCSVSSRVKLNKAKKDFARCYLEGARALIQDAPLLDDCVRARTYLKKASEYFNDPKGCDLVKPVERELNIERLEKINELKNNLSGLVASASATQAEVEAHHTALVLSDAISILADCSAQAMDIKEALWGDEVVLDDFKESDFRERPDRWVVVKQIRKILEDKDRVDQSCTAKFNNFIVALERLDVLSNNSEMDRDEIARLWAEIEVSRYFLNGLLNEAVCARYEALAGKLAALGFTIRSKEEVQTAIVVVPVVEAGAGAALVVAPVVASAAAGAGAGVRRSGGGAAVSAKVSAAAKAVSAPTDAVAKRVASAAAYDVLFVVHTELLAILEKFDRGDDSQLLKGNLPFILIRWFEALLKTNLVAAARGYARQIRNSLAHPFGRFDFVALKTIAEFLRSHESDLVKVERFEDRPKVAERLRELHALPSFKTLDDMKSDGDLLPTLLTRGRDILNLCQAWGARGDVSLQAFVAANADAIRAAAYAVICWVEALANAENKQVVYDRIKSKGLLEVFDRYFSGLSGRFRFVRNTLVHEQLSLTQVAELVVGFNRNQVNQVVRILDSVVHGTEFYSSADGMLVVSASVVSAGAVAFAGAAGAGAGAGVATGFLTGRR